MDFSWTADQLELRMQARRVADEAVAEHGRSNDSWINGFSKEFASRMGDLGWMDDRGRLWFCGRKAHRVVTSHGPMYTVPCEAVFNTHAAVRRSALVGVEIDGSVEPVLVVERDPLAARLRNARLVGELLEIAGGHQHTESIQKILFYKHLPVDIRHNCLFLLARHDRFVGNTTFQLVKRQAGIIGILYGHSGVSCE